VEILERNLSDPLFATKHIKERKAIWDVVFGKPGEEQFNQKLAPKIASAAAEVRRPKSNTSTPPFDLAVGDSTTDSLDVQCLLGPTFPKESSLRYIPVRYALTFLSQWCRR